MSTLDPAPGGKEAIDPEGLIRDLGLSPHPEGGHFREVYRSTTRVLRGDAYRTSLTSIYFLLTAGEHSRWHVVAADEAWHFYCGAPLELLTFDPEVRLVTRTLLATPPFPGAQAVSVVPAGHWQAARSTGPFSLTGCTVGPGFEFEDFAFVSDLPSHEAAFSDSLRGYRDLL